MFAPEDQIKNGKETSKKDVGKAILLTSQAIRMKKPATQL